MSKANATNPKIGLDNVVIAKLLTDVGGSVPPTYDTPIALKGAVSASVNPNSSVEVDYADNGAFFVTGNRANTEMSLEFTNIDPDTMALMLGQERANGVTIEKPLDQAPYFALGFRIWIGGTDADGNNIYEYVWYAKGKFSVPESGGTTKQDSVDFQHTSLTAQFVSTQYSKDGKGNGVICSHCRSDIDSASDLIADWFNAPVVDTGVNLGAVTVAIAKSSTTKITITGTKTGGTMKFADNAVLGENVIVTTSAGVEIAGSIAKTSDTVLTFTSDEAMTGSVVVAVTKGLKDINGVSVTPKTTTVSMA